MSRTVIELDRTGAAFNVAQLRPLRDNVLIRLIEREKTVGGKFFIVGEGTTSAQYGEIVALGSGVENLVDPGRPFPMDLKPGDPVLKMRYTGDEMALRMGRYNLVREHGLWAKVRFKGDPANYELAEIEPRMDCVLVELHQQEQTRGGILFPNAKDRAAKGCLATVVKVGPGPWHAESAEDCRQCALEQHRIPLHVFSGEEVFVHQYAGEDLEMDGKIYRIMQYGDIEGGIERVND